MSQPSMRDYIDAVDKQAFDRIAGMSNADISRNPLTSGSTI